MFIKFLNRFFMGFPRFSRIFRSLSRVFTGFSWVFLGFPRFSLVIFWGTLGDENVLCLI